MQVISIQFTPLEVAMEVASFSIFIYFQESAHLLPSTSMEACKELQLLWKQHTTPYTSIYLHEDWKLAGVHGSSSSLRLRLGWGLVLSKYLEVCDIRGSGWKFAGVYRSLWKFPLNIFMEAAIDGNNGTFNSHRQWKLPCTCMEASIKIHGGNSTSTNLHGNFHGRKCTSTDLYGSFHGSKLTFIEASTDVGGYVQGNTSNARRWTPTEVM